MMETATVLWGLNAALLIVIAVLARNVVGARRFRFRNQRRKILVKAISELPPPQQSDDLAAAWSLVLDSVSGATLAHATGLPKRILALELADDDVVQLFRPDLTRAVNSYNDLCALIDDGLLRPKDIAKKYPVDHQNILLALNLLEPFIWYESILRGRGRWGFRVARLRHILEELRPASPRPSLQRARRVEVRGLVLMDLREIRPFVRFWRSMKLAIRSPTINVRSKVRQEKYRAKLADELAALGVAVHRPDDGQRTVEW